MRPFAEQSAIGGAGEHESPDAVGKLEREFLRDHAAHGSTGNMGGVNACRIEYCRSIVSHSANRVRSAWAIAASDAAIIE